MSNNPLYVIDGAVYAGVLSDINPDDVETISILKDAASTSLYGSAAANGVVLITTKKGKKGSFNFSTSTAVVSKGIPEYDRVGAEDYYKLTWDALNNSAKFNPSLLTDGQSASTFASDGLIPILQNNIYNVPDNEVIINGQLNPNAKMLYNDFNWEKYIQRKGVMRNYNLNYSGATDKSNYYASFGYSNGEGYVIKTNFKRYTSRLNVDSQVTNWLKLGSNMSGSISKAKEPMSALGASLSNPFYVTCYMGSIYSPFVYNDLGVLQYGPNGKPLFSDGSERGRGSGAGLGRNIIQEMLLNDVRMNTEAINTRYFAEINILKGLKFISNVSLDLLNYTSTTYGNKTIGDAQGTGFLENAGDKSTTTTFNQILDYSYSFNKNNFNLILGHESFKKDLEIYYIAKSNEIVENNLVLSNFTTTVENDGYKATLSKDSYFARLNYDYANKYLLSGSIRSDRSSRFAPDKNRGTFWSLAAGWNLHLEGFLKNSNIINQLKLRTSYGQVGNDGGVGTNPGYYANLTTYGLGYIL